MLVDAHVQENATRIDDEGAAVRRPVLEKYVEGTAQRVCGVGDYRVVDAREARIRLEPGLVAVVAVRARRKNDRTLAEEVIMALRKRRELGRADEREVARVEKQDDPAAAVTRKLEHARRALPADIRLHAVVGNGLTNSERHGAPNRCFGGSGKHTPESGAGVRARGETVCLPEPEHHAALLQPATPS